MKSKKALKIPGVLVCLGYAVEIVFKDGDQHKKIRWKKKDGMDLYSSNSGNQLWIVKTKRAPVDKKKFFDAVYKKRTAVEKGLNLYQKWHETEPISGSILSAPKGFMFSLGRVVSITYSSDKWNGKQTRYIHTFKKLPIVWANNKRAPMVLELTGGKIAVKNEGITG